MLLRQRAFQAVLVLSAARGISSCAAPDEGALPPPLTKDGGGSGAAGGAPADGRAGASGSSAGSNGGAAGTSASGNGGASSGDASAGTSSGGATGGAAGSSGSAPGGAGGGAPCTSRVQVTLDDAVTGAGRDQLDFQGSWQTSTGASKHGGGDHYSTTVDARLRVRFEGDRVHLHGARDSHHGIAEVTVDASPAAEVDLYAADRAEDARLWSSPELSPGEHVVTVRVTGRRNAAATGMVVAVDRLVLERVTCGGDGGSDGSAGRGGTGGTGGSAGAAGAGGTSGRGGSGGTAGSSGSAGSAGTNGAGGTTARNTMYVSGRDLFTTCGEKVVLRGVNHPTMYVDRGGSAIPEIAKTGANTVRLFWYAKHGVAISEADAVIGRVVAAGMIPMLEMHDATGPSAWGNMADIVAYWTSSSALALIQKYRSRLLVNIANEAGPNAGQDYAGFESTYKSAITSLRNAGIEVPIVIDAGGWGRDYEVLFQRGPALITHDPRHNLILSAHLYDVMTRAQIAAVYQRAVTANLPFIVGEFAHRAPAGGCGPALDYLALIGEAQPRSIGWLAWSWGDNDPATWWNGDCGEFDMTRTFAYDTLERWGREVAVTDANSIANTSVRPASFASGSCP